MIDWLIPRSSNNFNFLLVIQLLCVCAAIMVWWLMLNSVINFLIEDFCCCTWLRTVGSTGVDSSLLMWLPSNIQSWCLSVTYAYGMSLDGSICFGIWFLSDLCCFSVSLSIMKLKKCFACSWLLQMRCRRRNIILRVWSLLTKEFKCLIDKIGLTLRKTRAKRMHFDGEWTYSITQLSTRNEVQYQISVPQYIVIQE